MAVSMDNLSSSNEFFLKSAPVEVRLAGFKSTTTELQRAGWEISVETFRLLDCDGYDTRVAFRHDGVGQMAIGLLTLSREAIMSFMNKGAHYNPLFGAGIDITAIAPSIQFRMIPERSISAFHAIDARPSLESLNPMTLNLEDVAGFKKIQTAEEFEIFLNKKDEQEILEIILKKQDLKQREIVLTNRRRAFREGHGQEIQPPKETVRSLIVCA